MTDDMDAFPVETRARSSARVPEDLHDLQGPDRAEETDDVLAVLWKSRSAGNPHLVSVVFDPRGRRLQCVCTSAAIRGDCWAVQETRRLFGWPEPERT